MALMLAPFKVQTSATPYLHPAVSISHLQVCTMRRMGDPMRVIGRTFGGRQLSQHHF
jgi:hypothetical protein